MHFIFSPESHSLLFLGLVPEALGWQEIMEESCTNFSKLGNTFCGNQREQAPKIPKENDKKAIDEILFLIELNRNVYY